MPSAARHPPTPTSSKPCSANCARRVCLHEEVRTRLEDINVGRLRIATKGLVRSSAGEGAPSRLVEVTEERQKIDGMFMMGQVAALHDGLCSIEELHQEVTAGYTVPELISEPGDEAAAAAKAAHKAYRQAPEPIAIVGMSCHLPGASDLYRYWSNIVRRVDAIIEIPPDRWPSNLFFDTDAKAPDRSISKWGGFMQPIRFDPVSYGIPPASLASVEPVHLILLEVTRKALADAGYDKRPFARETTAVILGLGGGTWDLGQSYLARCLTEHMLHQIPGIDPAARDHVISHFRKSLPETQRRQLPRYSGQRRRRTRCQSLRFRRPELYSRRGVRLFTRGPRHRHQRTPSWIERCGPGGSSRSGAKHFRIFVV